MTIKNKPRKLKIDHIFRMTDDTGILHHSNCGVPDHSKGYTTVDNARALIMAVKMIGQTHTKKFENHFECLINTYVSFLSGAQNADGTFRNSMGYNREFIDEIGTEECFGRCLWALCYTYSDQNVSQSIKQVVWELIDKALQHCMKVKSSRAIAYVIIGLNYLNQEKTNEYISKLAASLVDHYIHHKSDNWHWFEASLTGCNAVLPWALLTAFRVTKESRYFKIGMDSLQFLESKTFTKYYFKPIGQKEQNCPDNEIIQFDGQTLEASETTAVYIEAFLLTNKPEFIGKAKTCFYWYLGKNAQKHSLIDAETGGCHDGIEFDRLNPNQGAESIISFWLAYLEIKKYLKPEK